LLRARVRYNLVYLRRDARYFFGMITARDNSVDSISITENGNHLSGRPTSVITILRAPAYAPEIPPRRSSVASSRVGISRRCEDRSGRVATQCFRKMTRVLARQAPARLNGGVGHRNVRFRGDCVAKLKNTASTKFSRRLDLNASLHPYSRTGSRPPFASGSPRCPR